MCRCSKRLKKERKSTYTYNEDNAVWYSKETLRSSQQTKSKNKLKKIKENYTRILSIHFHRVKFDENQNTIPASLLSFTYLMLSRFVKKYAYGKVCLIFFNKKIPISINHQLKDYISLVTSVSWCTICLR